MHLKYTTRTEEDKKRLQYLVAKKNNAVKPAGLGSRQPTSIEGTYMSFPFRHVQQSVNCVDVITIFICLCIHFCSSLFCYGVLYFSLFLSHIQTYS
jgi:hypothetical protein